MIGHETQSLALASVLAKNITSFHCAIRQPWLSFTPRILPRFGKNIIWKKQKPDLNQSPDAIITCGRRMAAIGKYYKRLTKSKHVQILNPGDDPEKYDVVVCPEHDALTGGNVVQSKGSLHNISASSLSRDKLTCQNSHNIYKNKVVSILLGNPNKTFFKKLNMLSTKIAHHFPKHGLIVCGSRRTPKKYYSKIKRCFSHAQLVWLDGNSENPYKCLLACSDVFIVTADSINMVSEACATNKPVIAIAQERISPKHKRFIESIDTRLSGFDNNRRTFKPMEALSDVSPQVLNLLISD